MRRAAWCIASSARPPSSAWAACSTGCWHERVGDRALGCLRGRVRVLRVALRVAADARVPVVRERGGGSGPDRAPAAGDGRGMLVCGRVHGRLHAGRGRHRRAGRAVPRPPARPGASGRRTGDRDGRGDAVADRQRDAQQLEATGAGEAARPDRCGGGRGRLRGGAGARAWAGSWGGCWPPCSGARRGGILAIAGSRGHAGQGALLLLVYGLGLGVPFIAAGIWLPVVIGATRTLRDHWGVVTRVSGAVLIVAGVLLASGRLTDLTARLAG